MNEDHDTRRDDGDLRPGDSRPAPATRPTGIAIGLVRGAILGAVIAGAAIGWTHWQHSSRPAIAPAHPLAQHAAPRSADLRGQAASTDVRLVADWVAETGDAAGAGFVIVDKKDATVYVFDDAARLRAASPILLGSARGDDTVPGVGLKAIADVLPEERTTPAGRFLGERGMNARGEDVVWVDYDAAVSMHRVITSNPKEHRLERLATPTRSDNRISYGCINVPVAFFEQYIAPAFLTHKAMVYVLPETKSLEEVFGMPNLASVQPLHASTRAAGTAPATAGLRAVH